MSSNPKTREHETVQVPIVYHPDYNVTFFGLQKLHPFDSCKYEKIAAAISKLGYTFHTPAREMSREELLVVHTPEYLDSLNASSNVARVCEMPPLYIIPNFILQRKMLTPMRMQVRGTVLAGELAIKHGWAINLGGGMHHASYNHGGGWCVYSDIILSFMNLREQSKTESTPIKRGMIIDLDVHQGNGHERDKLKFTELTDDLFILDAYNSRIYPDDRFARRAINTAIEVNEDTSVDTYLHDVKQAVERDVAAFKPQVIFYNAGTDILTGDPLNGGVSISQEGIIERDKIVFRTALAHQIPVVMVLSGGYARGNAAVVASSIISLLTDVLRFGQ